MKGYIKIPQLATNGWAF